MRTYLCAGGEQTHTCSHGGPVTSAWRNVEVNLPVVDLAWLIPGLKRGGLPNFDVLRDARMM